MKTKVVFCLFLIGSIVSNCLGQKVPDSSKGFASNKVVKIGKDTPQVVINGQLQKFASLEKIDPKEISDIIFLNDSLVNGITEGTNPGGTIVVNTWSYKESNYKKVFSEFSKQYKNYLVENKNADDEVVYVINTVRIDTTRNVKTNMLFAIKPDSIKSVEFIKIRMLFIAGYPKRPLVHIKTKNFVWKK